jgi:hypothetical protein
MWGGVWIGGVGGGWRRSSLGGEVWSARMSETSVFEERIEGRHDGRDDQEGSGRIGGEIGREYMDDETRKRTYRTIS